MVQELTDIFERNFPYVERNGLSVQRILGHKENMVIARRDEKNRLIGAAVVNQSTILMLCVDQEYRGQGIGSELLKKAEDAIWEKGFEKINVGVGFDYLAPGVPTSKCYFPAENEKLYPGLDETASDFFTHRGYVHSWGCNCFDMRFSLNEFEREGYDAGVEIDGITYRFASLGDKDAVCACMDDAYPEFTGYYRDDILYQEGKGVGVLIAVSGNEVIGALIIGTEDAEKGLGSVGCVAVREGWRGRHIAVNLVTVGTKHLKKNGFLKAYLSYTYSGLDHMYGYAGYKICVYFMMAEKYKRV
ncbi:MAG: GNAT family N-acetyltransferase [Lachnospiraceae bacterium]|nr:GNAT family N-acetyltransferase [Lachnospiraceae bacterium]